MRLDSPAMRFDDSLDNRQTQPCAAGLSAARFIAAVETVEAANMQLIVDFFSKYLK